MKIYNYIKKLITHSDSNAIWIVFFLVLALALRVWGNTLTPPSPYWEEVALGFDAYSVLKTGADRLGNSWPVVAFTSFGDYKPSLYFYALLPAIKLFGLSTFAVRLPAAIFSAGSVAVTYLLARKWFKKPVAFWSALLLCFQPWSWQVGRAGFEVNLATFLIVSGVYLLILSLEKWKNKPKPIFWWLSISSAFLLVLSMYAYHGARLLAPLMAASLVVIYYIQNPTKDKKIARWLHWLPSLTVAVILLIPILLVISQPVISQRFAETSVFTLMEPITSSNHWREIAGNTLLAKIAFHRYFFWGSQLLQNYWSHFSPTFLFGLAENNARHLSGYLGALYPWELITLLLGLSFLRQWSNNRSSWQYLLVLILLTPLASTLTKTNPHALRTLPLSIWLAMVSAVGLVQLQNTFTDVMGKMLPVRKTLALLSFLMVLVSWSFLWNYMRWQYPIQHSDEWQYGYQQLYDQLVQLKSPQEQVYVSRQQGRPAMYLFFTQQIDPYRVQQAAQDPQTNKDQQELLDFEDWHFNEDRNSTGLHAVAPNDIPSETESILSIHDLNQEDIWIIYRAP